MLTFLFSRTMDSVCADQRGFHEHANAGAGKADWRPEALVKIGSQSSCKQVKERKNYQAKEQIDQNKILIINSYFLILLSSTHTIYNIYDNSILDNFTYPW